MEHMIRKVTVLPKLPKRLNPLMEISNNLWWSFDVEAIDLIKRIDRKLWKDNQGNPIKILALVSDERLKELSTDESFLYHMDNVYSKFKSYMKSKTWFKENFKNFDGCIAYFSAEYGISDVIPIYSGGLGILAGDHVKSASDLGLPFYGVGLLYTQGYFRQYLNMDGWQQEVYPKNDFFTMPIEELKNDKGEAIKISVEFPDGLVHAALWKIKVGRVEVILLDTNIAENTFENRKITAQLYGGDIEMRIKQEILLGIGGVRALHALGRFPKVTHMNEGHSAFMALERIRVYMQEGLNFNDARELVMNTSVFTTHTPVPAGNDRFSYDMVEKYLKPYISKYKMPMDKILDLGYEPVYDKDGKITGKDFCMTVFALNNAIYNNGVSKLHGEVSRDMWKWMWPELSENEVPIDHITNGVHAKTWISDEMAALYDRYLGPRWIDEPWNHKIWSRVKDIPSTELWHAHERMRERLVSFVRNRLRDQLIQKGVTGNGLNIASEVLDPTILTIGFARRFATYKRAILFFKDLERVVKIITNKEHPVQIVFAGKAHPKDDAGKKFIKEIYRITKRSDLVHSVVFLEDYDIRVAKYLVQGVDVWLNTPRRPLEASGTSGMKVSFNGGLNFSILDGWWDEAYDGTNGWAIGRGEEYPDKEDFEYQDYVESNDIYNTLEESLIPMYYDRGPDGLPHRWIDFMKNNIMTVCPFFDSGRQVEEYTEKFYVPAGANMDLFSKNKFKNTQDLVSWKLYVEKNWHKVKMVKINFPQLSNVKKGDSFKVGVTIDIDGLKPNDLIVSIYRGVLDSEGKIIEGKDLPMKVVSSDGSLHNYELNLVNDTAGVIGYSVRAMATHPNLINRFHLSKIVWG